MTLLIITSIISIIVFGTIAILFSYKEENAKIKLIEREKKLQNKLYELAVLKEIQDKISYSLDIDKILRIIIGSLNTLIPFSSASSLILKDNELIFQANIHEHISTEFVNTIKERMKTSLFSLVEKKLPEHMYEHINGVTPDPLYVARVASSFQIPLFINNKPIGIINIASKEENLYKDEEIATTLYQIIEQAMAALSRLESLLSSEKRKLMAMIGSLADGVFMLDANNSLLVINETAKSFFAITSNNIQIEDIASKLSPDYDIKSKCKEAIEQKKSIEDKEVTISGKTFQIIINPVLEPAANVLLGVSVLIHDITADKSLARMKDDFTNMVVHELRAPLTAIKDASRVLVDNNTMKQEEKEKLMLIMNQQSQKMLNDIATILDAAKFDAGQFVFEKTPTDIVRLIKERVAFFLPQAANKHIHLLATFSEDIPEIVVDSARIGQVINNLVSNSMKFTPENGKIIVNVSSKTHLLTVSVSDTGLGIPKEKQSELFHRYYQVAQTQGNRGRNSSGTGLGLYVVKKIIEGHKGTITLHSEPGYGTTITFTLPYITLAKSADEKPPVPHHRILN